MRTGFVLFTMYALSDQVHCTIVRCCVNQIKQPYVLHLLLAYFQFFAGSPSVKFI